MKVLFQEENIFQRHDLARLVVIFKSVSTLKNTFKCFWDKNKMFDKF